MKRPVVEVTVNFGEHYGKKGIVVAYDRNKYYEVEFTDGETSCFKGYYLDGINVLGKKRYLLPDFYETDTNKEIWADYKRHTRYPSTFETKEVEFNMYLRKDENSKNCDIRYKFYTLDAMKKHIRHAVQNNLTFEIVSTRYSKYGFGQDTFLIFDNTKFSFGVFRTKDDDDFYTKRYYRAINKFVLSL